jgi:hypothetical protein
MLTQERINELYNEARVRMDSLPMEIQEHLIRKHNGVPSSTCHTCISLGANLRSKRILLETLEPLVKKGKKL